MVEKKVLENLAKRKIKIFMTIVVDRVFIDRTINFVFIEGNMVVETMIDLPLNGVHVLVWAESVEFIGRSFDCADVNTFWIGNRGV